MNKCIYFNGTYFELIIIESEWFDFIGSYFWFNLMLAQDDIEYHLYDFYV